MRSKRRLAASTMFRSELYRPVGAAVSRHAARPRCFSAPGRSLHPARLPRCQALPDTAARRTVIAWSGSTASVLVAIDQLGGRRGLWKRRKGFFQGRNSGFSCAAFPMARCSSPMAATASGRCLGREKSSMRSRHSCTPPKPLRRCSHCRWPTVHEPRSVGHPSDAGRWLPEPKRRAAIHAGGVEPGKSDNERESTENGYFIGRSLPDFIHSPA